MKKINNGGSAFPMQESQAIHAYAAGKVAALAETNTDERDRIYLAARAEAIGGLSVRDYFAAHAPAMPPALREMAKNAEKSDGRDTSDYGNFAFYEAMWRYAYADAMLKARAA